MDLRWLEAFIALAETQSIRSAAVRLNMSPSTLAAHITALEDYLGISLLDRSAAGSLLSERGRIYLPEAEQLLKNWGRIKTQAQMLEKAPSSRLRMVVQGHILPPPPLDKFLRQFLSRNYHVVPELYDDREYGIEDGLYNRQLDLYFAFCPPTLDFPGISHQTISSTRLCALVPHDHPLAKRDTICLSDLAGETLLLSPETKVPYLRAREVDALQATGIHYFTLDGHFTPRLQDMLVGLGRGIAILPHSQCFTTMGAVTVLPLTDPICQCSMEMLYLTDNDNPVLWQFLADLNKERMGGGLDEYGSAG